MTASVDHDRVTDTVPLALTLFDENGAALRETLTQHFAPGRWDVLLPGVTSGAYKITATLNGQDRTLTAATAVPIPHEELRPKPDDTLFNALGAFAPLAATRAATLPKYRTIFIDIRDWLAVASIVLLLAQVAVRRWPSRQHPMREVAA
jgi:hypothetical protein